MSPIIVLALIVLATLSDGQVVTWKTTAKKRLNGFPKMNLEIPAGRNVLVTFKRFSLDGDSDSCEEDSVVIQVIGIDDIRQSIDFCGERAGEVYQIRNPSDSDSAYIYAYTELPRQSVRRQFVILFKLLAPGFEAPVPDLPFLEEAPEPPVSTSAPTAPPSPSTSAPTNPPPPSTSAPTNPPSPTSPPTGAFECGKPISERIVGGTEASPFSIPWQVAITPSFSMRPFCGGTLISPLHVMTAAHCTEDSDVSSFRVVVGEHNTASTDDGTPHTIACKMEHPRYGFPRFDFSILTLDEPVDITASSMARVACLPSDPNRLYDNGENMTVSGWGRLEEGGFSPTVLHHVEVPGVTNEVCQEDYAAVTRIRPEMMCAGKDEGGIDSCQGDSGGPLTFEENGTTDLVGVVSFGIGCARETHYGVYARITDVLPWIIGAGVQANENRCPM